ncbi:hypothetical protein OFO01_07055 [Campylobacter sp. JMF_01 NE2]|uniref:hypothetical protein n=1 Tax=unclassified Campylobacter TaxID=2593542 RepID=UPI0022E9B3AD|nr:MULTISPECIES: hypothetical protein [unclassified Campylobacter]MDA3053279.1 hypothetical protein [Campylobacter sp. JMF_03 NE3]MDA3067538.1 hypothetical protein [Campylobacter sp. JMF_01 NE2]
MKKSLLSVALMAMLGSSSLMADIDDYVANDNNQSVNEFVRKILIMAEKGDMDILDFYSNQVLPSEAGLPLTQEDLKERIVKNLDNIYVLPDGKETLYGTFDLYAMTNKINDDNTIEVLVGCGVKNADGIPIPRIVEENNNPLIISIENGKYRVKSMPEQNQKGCTRNE